MKFVWHADNLSERDWLRYAFSDVITGEITDLDLTCFEDDTIHVVSSNWAPLPRYTDYFCECRSRCRNIMLMHVSDEWFSGGYQLYGYFDLVFRWNHSYLTSAPGIITIPLGYPNGTVAHAHRPVDQRQYVWSFIGEIKSSRIAMASAFDSLHPRFVTGTDSLSEANPKRLSKSEFDAILFDTVFSPCPMGNATIDTNRVYESLEFGCIPLIELRATLDYYSNLLGPNPMPAFYSWHKARAFAERLYNDKSALCALQERVTTWWSDYKVKLRVNITDAIQGPSHASDLRHFVNLPRNRHTVLHEPLRIAEIMRHQTLGSLARRLSRPAGPLKRILFDTSRGKLATPSSVIRKEP